MRVQEAGAGPGEHAGGFGGEWRCPKHATGLAGLLQVKLEVVWLLGAAAGLGGCLGGIPEVRRVQRRRRGGAVVVETSRWPGGYLQRRRRMRGGLE